MSVIIKFSRLAKGRSVHGQLYSCCQYAKSWIEWRWHRFFHDFVKMQDTSWSELTHQMQTQARKRYMKTEISNLITLCSVDSCLSTEVIPFAILILNQHYSYWYLDIYIKQQHFGTLLFLLLGEYVIREEASQIFPNGRTIFSKSRVHKRNYRIWAWMSRFSWLPFGVKLCQLILGYSDQLFNL